MMTSVPSNRKKRLPGLLWIAAFLLFAAGASSGRTFLTGIAVGIALVALAVQMRTFSNARARG